MDIKDKAEKYTADAQKRALRRRSPLNLLLPLLHWPLTMAFWFLQLQLFYPLFSGRSCDKILVCIPQGIPAVIFAVAPFFPSIPASMLLANFLLWLIPPVRRVFDGEAAPYPQTSFRRSQRVLALFLCGCIAVAWPLMFVAGRFLQAAP
jgi:hypothetical protein